MFNLDGCCDMLHLPLGLDALCHCVPDLCAHSQRWPRRHFTDCGGGVHWSGLVLSKCSKYPGHPINAQLDCDRILQTNLLQSWEQVEWNEQWQFSLLRQPEWLYVQEPTAVLLSPTFSHLDSCYLRQVPLHDQPFNLPDHEQGVQAQHICDDIWRRDCREEASTREEGELKWK